MSLAPSKKKKEMEWKNLKVPECVLQTIENYFKLKCMTTIQNNIIENFLKEKNVVAYEVTGSGKTLAFLVPMLKLISECNNSKKPHELRGIIISPSQKLATQTSHVLAKFLNNMNDAKDGVTQMLIGRSKKNTLCRYVNEFNENGANILVATPERLNDLLTKIKLNTCLELPKLKMLVLDEADKLLRFKKTITDVLKKFSEVRVTGLFSATPNSTLLEKLVKEALNDFIPVNVKEKSEGLKPYESKKFKEIPKGWIDCPNESGKIISKKFVAFKTPLDDDDAYAKIPGKQTFNIKSLSHIIKDRNIGLLIDLTNTNRFYDKSKIEKLDCIYKKIECVGHEQPPTPKEAESFVHTCSEFIKDKPLKLIGVHCTHGFNRTGFMIATYLIKESKDVSVANAIKKSKDVSVANAINKSKDDSVAEAIKNFAKARSPGIFKQDYIVELYFQNEFKFHEKLIEAGKPPNWYSEK